MFKIIMITAVIIMAIAWIVYGIWRYREYLSEKGGAKPTTEHLERIRKSFEDYTKKLKDYKRKPYERK